MAGIEHQYEYKPKWWAILLIGGFFSLAAVVCLYKIAHPWPENLPVVFWIALVLSLVGVALPGSRQLNGCRSGGALPSPRRLSFSPGLGGLRRRRPSTTRRSPG
jgi:hypothetical protein